MEEKKKHSMSKPGEHPEKPKADESAPPKALSLKEHEELLARLRELEAMREKWLRSAADFDNAKKRLAREKEEYLKFSQENLIRSLLPVLDNFERALAHGPSEKSGASGVLAGIEMVYKQLNEILKAQGLKRIKTVGEIFDPHAHEAVAFVQDEGRDHEIVEEVEAGYYLHDRLLRAPKVRVRNSPQNPEMDPTPTQPQP